MQLSVIWFGPLRNRQKAGELRNKDGGYMDEGGYSKLSKKQFIINNEV